MLMDFMIVLALLALLTLGTLLYIFCVLAHWIFTPDPEDGTSGRLPAQPQLHTSGISFSATADPAALKL